MSSQWLPQQRASHPHSLGLEAAYAYCRTIAKREAKNFYYSFCVLPRHKSNAMCAVYAFMRKADDLADDESLTLEARREAMAAWTADWRASRSAQVVTDPIFLALQDTQQRFAIPDELLEKLVQGTTLDLQPMQTGVTRLIVGQEGSGGDSDAYRRESAGQGTMARSLDIYDTFDGLYRYCYLVASVVGLVCIRIFGYTDPRAEELAERTGIAFQLTNILRDVREDAERGRIYLPTDDMRQTGSSAESVCRACAGSPLDDATRALLQLEIDRAQQYYRSAVDLIPLLDKEARPAMRVLAQIYHELLERIAADPAAVFQQRVSVSTARKLTILARGMVESLQARYLG
ncbi:MAG: phytoene/squalene synthase family protein [Acidobacteriaceae bacterium]